ncbi:MAG: hypothetical protein IKG27_04975 [Bacilli bacterium]|nr:hypothetical protein [Bacilli bacterium]
MKTKERKNKRRRKLLIPLFLSTFFLLTTTYAWFSANRMVSIESLQVHVQADGGLEVSTNAIDWKQVVTVQDIMEARTKYPNSINQIPYQMSPVSTGGGIGEGKLELFLGNATNDQSSDFILVANREIETESFGEESEGSFVAFDVFFRVKSSKELYLDGTSKIEYTGESQSGIENATRIAFLVEGSSEDVPNISQNLKGATTAIFWEPNYDVHTEYGVNHASTTYGLTTTQTGAAILPYDGVISNILMSDSVPISSANMTSYPAFFRSMNMDIATPKAGGPNQKILDLAPSVTKVRIYMWIEGQDVDCEDYASYGDITFDLKFTTNPA